MDSIEARLRCSSRLYPEAAPGPLLKGTLEDDLPEPKFPEVPPIDPSVRRALEHIQRVELGAADALGAIAGSQAFTQIQELATHVGRQPEVLLKALAPLEPVIEEMQRAAERRQSLLEQIFRPYQVSAFALHQLQNRLLGPLQALGEMDAREERLCGLLAQRGWVISPSLPYIATQELLRIHDEDGIEALEATLIALFDGERLAENLGRCYDRPSFERRRHLFEQALTAHRRGDYGLSVPVWLSQTDGIVFEELQIDKVFSRDKRRYQRLQTELGGEEEFRDHLLNGLLAVLEALGDSVSNLVTPEQVSAELRRHRILHGLDLEYGTERNSIQGVLILELFHMYFDARDGRATNPT